MNSKLLYRTKAITVYSTTDLEGVGSYRTIGDKVYKWVKNGESSALAANAAYCYAIASDATLTTVYASTTANLTFLAGIAQSAIPAGGYGWIQVRGVCTASVLGHASLAIGGALVPVNGQAYLTFGTAIGTAPIYRYGALALEAYTTTSAADKSVLLNGI